MFKQLMTHALASIALATAWSSAALAAYPEKALNLIVPYVAGSPADNVARMIGKELSARLGQPVIVDNRAGGNGMIGAEAGARARPDGYTLILGNMDTHALNSLLFKDIRYDVERDFKPVIQIGNPHTMLVARGDFPGNTLPEVLEASRKEPGKYTWGSWGQGSVAHLWGAYLNEQAGVEWLHVPYKGTPAAVVALLSGQIDFLFMPPSLAMDNQAAGKIKVLGVSSSERSKVYPEVPTIEEQGVAPYEGTTWFGLFAPAGTPDEIIERLNQELNVIVASPAAAATFASLALTPVGGTPQDLAATIEASREKWGKVITEHNIALHD
ncbi:MAG: tripartite tricarboxylate transporter substrate binding protein [Pigmentiphaga sp.]|nr:tripartite tricarboxylate transporter substrate binding protein [Pigmentiphaga sp.]